MANTARRTPQNRKGKASPASSGVKQLHKWVSGKNSLHTPKFQIITTCVVILVCLYIAVMTNILYTPEDKTILAEGVSWETVFTQKTMRSIRAKMEIAETDAVYLYAPPDVTVNSTGTITDFVLPLAVPDKGRYCLWEMQYQPAESKLYLRMTAKNKKQKDLSISLEELPAADEALKTFLLFPGKYISQSFPLPAEGIYEFTPATEFAVKDYNFSSELSDGTPGIWISSSGGGSVIDASFHPTGDYFAYWCTMIESPPESSQSSDKSSGSSQPADSPDSSRTKVLVMTELSSGTGIL